MQLRFIFAGLRCNGDKAWSLSRRACVSERRLLFLRSRHGCLSVVAQGDAVGMTGYYLRVKSSWDGITQCGSCSLFQHQPVSPSPGGEHSYASRQLAIESVKEDGRLMYRAGGKTAPAD